MNYTDYWVPFKATRRCFRKNSLEKYKAPALNYKHLFFSRIFTVSSGFLFFGCFLWLFLTTMGSTFETQVHLVGTLFNGNETLLVIGAALSFFLVITQIYFCLWYATRLSTYLSLNINLMLSSWWASKIKSSSNH